MFEDRYRKRKGGTILIIITIISLATALGLFFNTDNSILSKINEETKKINSFEIPNDLIKLPPKTTVQEPVSQNDPVKEITNIPNEVIVTPNTIMKFNIFFTLCGHTKMSKSIQASVDEVNMNKDELQEKYKDWNLTSFESIEASFIKTLTTYCPDHYIIGVHGETIAVYQYDMNGQKNLITETDIQISSLIPEDQQLINSGIVVDTEDELQSILEGFSD